MHETKRIKTEEIREREREETDHDRRERGERDEVIQEREEEYCDTRERGEGETDGGLPMMFAFAPPRDKPPKTNS